MSALSSEKLKRKVTSYLVILGFLQRVGRVCCLIYPIREAFPADMILKDGEFGEIENVVFGAPLDITNKYLRAVAYYEVSIQGCVQ